MTPQPIRLAWAAGIARVTGTAWRAATTVWVAKVPMPEQWVEDTRRPACAAGLRIQTRRTQVRPAMRQKRQLPQGARQARMT